MLTKFSNNMTLCKIAMIKVFVFFFYLLCFVCWWSILNRYSFKVECVLFKLWHFRYYNHMCSVHTIFRSYRNRFLSKKPLISFLWYIKKTIKITFFLLEKWYEFDNFCYIIDNNFLTVMAHYINIHDLKANENIEKRQWFIQRNKKLI